MQELIYHKAKNYDLLFKENPELIEFFLKQIVQSGGKVLELACGTGRIAIPLAHDGIDITGIDNSPEMLAVAKEKSESNSVNIKWLHADMRGFSLQKKFDLIFISGNSLCHLLTIEDFENCMKCVKNHLVQDGRFIIDVLTPSLKILSRDSKELFPFSEYHDAITDEKVAITSSAKYDSATQINHVITYYHYTDSLKDETGSLTMRMYFSQELLALVKYNGFKVEQRFGDYHMSPFDENSSKQILVLKAINR